MAVPDTLFILRWRRRACSYYNDVMTVTTLPSRTVMLRAVEQRDTTWQGVFVYAVSTTGVACLPGCASRMANPEHISFYPSLDDAVVAGYRPCRRCNPIRMAVEPEWWDRALALAAANASRPVHDSDLRKIDIDPVKVRRHAHRRYGMTFHALLRRRRVNNAHLRLRSGEELDTVIIESGWDSHSGFREAFSQAVGTTPGRANEAEPISFDRYDSPIGPLHMAAVSAGVCLLEFADEERVARQAERLVRWFGGPVVPESNPHLDTLRHQLDRYFATELTEFTVPLVTRGTPFELATWSALRSIPYGETRSYADIALAIGKPKAFRAVGSANGRNRIAIVIPCHRVVNADGKLGGYGGGLWRKRRLLELERVSRSD